MTGASWTPPPVAGRVRDTRGDVRFYAGDDAASRCASGLCGRMRAYDGLCFFHLAYAEHVSDYMGPAHDVGDPVPGCEFCPDPGRRVSRLVAARLEELAGLADGWVDGRYGVAPTAAALAAAEEFWAVAADDGLLLFGCPGEDGSVCIESPVDVEPWRSMDVLPDGSFLLFGDDLDDDPDGLACASAVEAWAVWREPSPSGHAVVPASGPGTGPVVPPA